MPPIAPQSPISRSGSPAPALFSFWSPFRRLPRLLFSTFPVEFGRPIRIHSCAAPGQSPRDNQNRRREISHRKIEGPMRAKWKAKLPHKGGLGRGQASSLTLPHPPRQHQPTTIVLTSASFPSLTLHIHLPVLSSLAGFFSPIPYSLVHLACPTSSSSVVRFA
jgi:hypothetical protein